MVSIKTKKRMTYFTLGSFFFFGGVEYAVILPSIWLYIHTKFKAQEYFLGLMLSAFCFSGLFSGPIMGRWADKSRQVRLILMLAAMFEMGGSFMYFIGYSTWFLVGSRLVSGMGVGGEAVILAEIARFTSEEERTGVISILIAVRQSGLLLGPGFNFFLSKIDFFIGPFRVDKFTSPGLLMTLIWLIMEILLVTLFTEPETLFSRMRVMQHVETTYAPIQNSDDELYTEIQPSVSQVTYDDVYPDINQATPEDLQTPVPIQKGMTNSESANIASSVGNSSAMNISIGSVGSVESSVSIGNSTHLIESAEIIIQTDSGSNDKSKLLNRQSSRRKKRKDLLDSLSRSSSSQNGQVVEDTEDPISVGKLKFFYDEYIREEIVTLLGLQFITIFVQVALETMVTPLTDKFLHWDEFDNSLLYCGAGIEIIIMFLVTRWLSRRLEDRYLLMIGGLVLTTSNAWLLYFLPSCTVDTPMRTLAGFIVGVFLDMVALPFLMVCGVSLYSKLTRKETQGLSQGIRRSVAGVGTILAPLWAGSTTPMPYVMIGVILGLLIISQVMFFMSFSRLKVPKDNTPTPVSETPDRDVGDSERRPLLGQIS